MGDPAVEARALALHEASLLGSADQLRDGALRQLKPLGELRHRRLLAVIGSALDHEQEQVALRRQPSAARVSLRAAQEPAQGGAEICHPCDFLS